MRPLRISTRVPALLGLTLLIGPGSLFGQTIPAGSWTGTVSPPDGDPVAVTYNVTASADTIRMTITAPEFGQFDVYGITVSEDRLVFDFMPGPTVRCTLLKREDNSYAGNCVDSDGVAGLMVMIPPPTRQLAVWPVPPPWSERR